MPTPTDSLGFLISDVARLMRRSFGQRLEGSNLTMAQARALIFVARNEGVRQIDLADLLEVQPITLARLIDQLSADGLVERRSDPDDRRAYRIFLTPAAAPQIAIIENVAAAIRADALNNLNPDQADALIHALRTMRDNLSAR
ncbi:DNA-binding MarR family transcriptional regulator [Fluviicoccus keumensis]|uniref:DNA-binding MarR family transcriptional regulator n=1 Tax=Fluviicoccus keumensis TaxID=1435465 RepID=A0A4Q7ZAI5_9GAMM|nr:MarR family transcriptional regulator [Fluviicoccus keumensis]RZU47134.1 DNA-binding MarR family transcriptional regulator [Fluviicoccus keumensis]